MMSVTMDPGIAPNNLGPDHSSTSSWAPSRHRQDESRKRTRNSRSDTDAGNDRGAVSFRSSPARCGAVEPTYKGASGGVGNLGLEDGRPPPLDNFGERT